MIRGWDAGIFNSHARKLKQFLRSWSLHYGVQRQSRGGPSDKPDKVSDIVNKESKQGPRK